MVRETIVNDRIEIMISILIIEDEKAINDLVKMTLSHEGYMCHQAMNGIEAMNMVAKSKYDLILLDVNLPDIDGFSLYSHLGDTPVIFVTARDEIDDRLRGFGAGAEDYIIKPFDLQELLARIKVALRRKGEDGFMESRTMCFANIAVDLGKREAYINGEKVKLSNQEFALLEVLIEHKNQTLSREQLLQLAWDIDYEGELRTVDVHIRRLREKMKLDDNIVTVYKTGYRLEI